MSPFRPLVLLVYRYRSTLRSIGLVSSCHISSSRFLSFALSRFSYTLYRSCLAPSSSLTHLFVALPFALLPPMYSISYARVFPLSRASPSPPRSGRPCSNTLASLSSLVIYFNLLHLRHPSVYPSLLRTFSFLASLILSLYL